VKKPEEFRLAAAAGAALIDIATVSAIAAEVQTATRSNSQGSQTWGHSNSTTGDFGLAPST
jgi:uncharacterized low-complexity protein